MPSKQAYMLYASKMRGLSGLSSNEAKKAMQSNVHLSVVIPLDELKSPGAILRVLQIEW